MNGEKLVERPVETIIRSLNRAARDIEQCKVDTLWAGWRVMRCEALLRAIASSASHPGIADLIDKPIQQSREADQCVSLFYIAHHVARYLRSEPPIVTMWDVRAFWTSGLLEMACIAPLLRATARELAIAHSNGLKTLILPDHVWTIKRGDPT
jgi:hypothetical protein